MDWDALWNKISSISVDLVFKILGAIAVLVVGRILIRFIIKHFPKGTEKHPLDSTARQFFLSFTKITLYALLIIVAVGILGVPLASTVAVVGSAGAAIALALQGSLSNLASGIMLLIFKPMKIGDYVEVSGVSGTVSSVGIFYTTLVTVDNKHITLPNSSLTNTTIVNYSDEKTRRLDLVFPVDYSTDTEAAKEAIRQTGLSHPMVLRDPAPFVRLTDLDVSSLNITVRVWCLSENYWPLKFDLTEQVKATLDRNGITVPFPQVDVHMKQ